MKQLDMGILNIFKLSRLQVGVITGGECKEMVRVN